MTQSIYKLMIGASVLITSVAFLILVSCNGFADNTNAPDPTEDSTQASMPAPVPGMENGGGGNYRMAFQTGTSNNGTWYWQVWVYNIHNGNYKAYYWSPQDQKWLENFDGSTKLPSLP